MSARTALAAGLAIATALLCAAPALACDAAAHSNAIATPAHQGRAPLIIGDSTLILATPTFGRLGIESDAHGCRQFAAGVDILRARRAAGTLPRLVIMALGANGTISAGAMQAALQTVGRKRVLALVTAHNAPASDAEMRAAVRAHPTRVFLIDWLAYSTGHGSWFAPDGLHVTNGGAVIYAHFIRRAVRAFVDRPVRTLHLPHHSTDVRRCLAVHPHGLAIRVYIPRGADRATCTRARRLVHRNPLKPIPGWHFYDWRGTHDGPWTRVYVRDDHKVIVAAITHGEL